MELSIGGRDHGPKCADCGHSIWHHADRAVAACGPEWFTRVVEGYRRDPRVVPCKCLGFREEPVDADD